MSSFLLLESAVGYALFEILQSEEIGSSVETVRDAVDDLARFSRAIKLTSFRPFASAEESLGEVLAVSEGDLTECLTAFLQANLPKIKLSDKHRYLGVAEQKLGSMIQEALQVPVRWTEHVQELLRGVRLHLPHFVKALTPADLDKARLSLGHSYSRTRIKFNVHRQDNMIIQAIQLLDQLDKDVNTNAMRCREWYGWHFPELSKICPDSHIYAKVVNLVGNRASLYDKDEETALAELNTVTNDEDLSQQIYSAARNSMGMDVSDIDMLNMSMFAQRVEALSTYRHELHSYLTAKMELVAPNLNALLGEALGARLIAHAGSLTKLSKCPASTVQILGAEKALFRALKSKGNTPKFGLLFNSTFISRAATKNKGRISRYLANKCAIASRIDAFSDVPNKAFGEGLRGQVEDRLKFYETGDTPAKNIDVMLKIQQSLQHDGGEEDDDGAATRKKHKKSKRERQEEEPAAEDEGESPKEDKKKKKKKKAKHAQEA